MELEYEKLSQVIFSKLIPKLETNSGLYFFARERSKFEGWLKVELCGILSEYLENVIPEKEFIDVTSDNWAIELKTVNTNIRYSNVKNKSRPITKNVRSVIDDIEKLKSKKYSNRAVLFITFPIKHENENWQRHLKRISSLLKNIRHCEFNFSGEIPGVVYFGVI